MANGTIVALMKSTASSSIDARVRLIEIFIFILLLPAYSQN